MDEQTEQIEALKDLGDYIKGLLPDDVLSHAVAVGELTVAVKRPKPMSWRAWEIRSISPYQEKNGRRWRPIGMPSRRE